MSVEKPLRYYPNMDILTLSYHRILSNTIDGKLNNVATTSLKTGTASTTISNALCTVSSHIAVIPESVDAASALATAYIKTKTNGSFIIAHATTGSTASRTFTYTITG